MSMPFAQICSKMSCMKEFLKSKKVTYNLMSFTAFKSMILFSYLLEQPRSYEEIKEYFENHEFLRESISIDTLRVYINSLERLGCEIVRGRKAEGSKYKLLKHPFDIEIPADQIKSLIKVFKSLSKTIEIDDLISLTNFFDKIAKEINNDELRTALVNISPLRKINHEILDLLINACRRNDQISFMYNSPATGIKEIELLAEKLSVTNNKLYLYGISPQYKDSKASFLVTRITSKPIVRLNKTISIKITPLIVGCEIKDKNVPILENEKVIQEDDDKITIEITSDNKFSTIQRILSLGSACEVKYPESIRNEIYSILKKMKEEYIAEKI